MRAASIASRRSARCPSDHGARSALRLSHARRREPLCVCSTVIAVRAIVFDRIVEVVVQQATAALRALGVTHDRIEPFVILSASLLISVQQRCDLFAPDTLHEPNTPRLALREARAFELRCDDLAVALA